MKRKGSTKKVTKKKASRIGHLYQGSRLAQLTETWSSIPRGWIAPDGRFFQTKHHWDSISEHLGLEGENDPEQGERNAHIAYSLGWLSLGHGGALNAVGHKSTFDHRDHLAVITMRKLLSKAPHFTFRVELQLGKLTKRAAKHPDFEVKEIDLDYFISRGRLKADS